MKKRALRKEFFMEIRKSLPRFLSILFIVALGTAFYSGIQSSSPDMRYSGDAYFDAKELSDIQVTGTMGVTGDDVEALQNLKHIETAEGVCLKDVLTGEEGQRKVLRILSIPEKSNLVTVEEGEYPTKEDECLMDVQYAEHNGYQIGDTFLISEELEKELKVMDLAAFTLARDHKLPIRVFNMNKPGALRRVVMGEKEGTLITE
mgnify:CR=1 FL=1